MKLFIEVNVVREYGYKELEEMDVEEIGDIVMNSLADGFELHKVSIVDITKIHREVEE